MDPHSPPPQNGAAGYAFPSLPIVTPDPPRRSQREKYGGLFYLGIAGLAAVLGLVGWFVHGAWSHREIWTNVYLLHDEGRPVSERLSAALALSGDPRVNERQRWDMCLRRRLPPLARYVLARSLTAEAASADPRGYAVAVARSPDWPTWLRLLLTRTMAYAAIEGVDFPREPLVELAESGDHATALWATFVLSERDADHAMALAKLQAQAAAGDDALRSILLEAAQRHGNRDGQRPLLDQASRWIDEHHPEAVRLWAGWKVDRGRIVPRPAPELH